MVLLCAIESLGDKIISGMHINIVFHFDKQRCISNIPTNKQCVFFSQTFHVSQPGQNISRCIRIFLTNSFDFHSNAILDHDNRTIRKTLNLPKWRPDIDIGCEGSVCFFILEILDKFHHGNQILQIILRYVTYWKSSSHYERQIMILQYFHNRSFRPGSIPSEDLEFAAVDLYYQQFFNYFEHTAQIPHYLSTTSNN